MKFDDGKIQEILVNGNYVSGEDIKSASEFSKKSGKSFIDYLIENEVLSRDLLGQAISESLGIPYSDLNSNPPSQDQILKIPEEIAKKFRVVLFSQNEEGAIISTDDTSQNGLEEALSQIFPNTKLKITFSLSEDIDAILTKYRKTLETRFSKIIEEKNRVAPEIVDEILADALSYKVSDIHFEPHHDTVLLRFRIDGVLQEAGRIPKEYYENILNRIKVQSHLRIDEHLVSQDGAMRYEKDGVAADLRTSIVPTVEGEKVVLRVLASYVQGFTINDLGLESKNLELLQSSAKKPFGMILVVGPTGSGKTTTLYALLKLISNPDVNITTIEDPVEYKMSEINQIQVNEQTGLTFAKGLRSIVRQDPDIILVGEIRDAETAEIAVNAALTGHLLLSTFHSNDAATAIPRLLDMGSEPFLLASTLELIIAQRLVRKICDQCRHSTSVSSKDYPSKKAIFEKFFGKKKTTLYKGKGCPVCADTGYKGRTAIFELIRITAEMQDLILKAPSTNEIWKLAKKEGSTTLFENGVDKVKNGITTVEELMRVAEPPATNKKSG